MRRAYFDSADAVENLGGRSLRGGAVSMAAQGTNMAVQIGSTIVLARLLMPEDFGLVAMVVAITGFAGVFVDLGTRDALAQHGSITEGEVSALFWITFGLGFALTTATIVAAPLIAAFYAEPRLEHIALALSLNFLLPGLYFQHYALMRRALMFQTLAVVDVCSNLLATLAAITMAYQGFGYWALIARPIFVGVLTSLSVWIICRWIPGRPVFSSTVKELLKFGLNITGFTMTDYVAKTADRVALGYTTGPRELGYYQNATVVYDNPLNLFVVPLHNVAVATLSKLRNDLTALKRSWSTALSSLAYFSAPAFAILAVTAQDLVVLLLGEKWAEAGAILTVLALRGPAHVVERSLGWLHVAAGRADRWRKWGLVNCAVCLVALACGLPFGALGVATSYVVFMYLIFVPAIAYAGKPVGIGARDVLQAVGPQILASIVIAALGFSLRYMFLANIPALQRLVILICICGVAYLAIMTLLFRLTKPLQLVRSLASRRGVSNARM